MKKESDARNEDAKTKAKTKMAGFLFHANATVMAILALYFFVVPFFMMIYFMSDPALKGDETNRFALWLHRRLAQREFTEYNSLIHFAALTAVQFPTIYCGIL